MRRRRRKVRDEPKSKLSSASERPQTKTFQTSGEAALEPTSVFILFPPTCAYIGYTYLAHGNWGPCVLVLCVIPSHESLIFIVPR